MASGITPTRQRNAVSEGFALGLVVSGNPELPGDKLSLDLHFVDAWRNWQYASRFPQVSTDIRNGSDGMHVFTKATEGKSVWNLYWDTDVWPPAIRPRSQWKDGLDPAAAVRTIDGDVPVEGWVSLAQAFLKDD